MYKKKNSPLGSLLTQNRRMAQPKIKLLVIGAGLGRFLTTVHPPRPKMLAGRVWARFFGPNLARLDPEWYAKV
jgi:hypothetical protein